LTIFNHAAVPDTIEISFLGDDASEGEARMYRDTLNIEGAGQQTREYVVESQRYLIRYHTFEENSQLTDQDHVHFIPSGDGAGSLTFDIQETGETVRTLRLTPRAVLTRGSCPTRDGPVSPGYRHR